MDDKKKQQEPSTESEQTQEPLTEEESSTKEFWAKDFALSGLAAMFMAEDSVRKKIKDIRLPKELRGALLEGASKKKEDVYHLIAKEVRSFLSKVDINRELGKLLESHDVKVDARIQFVSKNKNQKNEAPSSPEEENLASKKEE